MNDAPAHIFISYSRKDGAGAAAALRDELVAEGFAIWQDLVALRGDRDWWSQIEDALRSKQLHHLVLIVTPGALASKYVRSEIRLARQEGKTVSAVKGPELGDLNKLPRWLGHIYDLDIPEQRKRFIHVIEGPASGKRVPMMAPEPPADFVQRPVEFGALKQKLLDAKGDAVAIMAALRGAGGYGKTTLAKALAHDPDIEDAYFDGILWVELGEKPENLLSIVADLIEILSGERPGLENLNAAAAKLGEELGDRRILLVIDDAWREQDLRPFSHGGRNTTRLITTRRDDILPVKAERQPVDAMAADEALSLLSWGLPEDQAAEQIGALAALARRLGEWAQLLKFVNGFLRVRVLKNHEQLPQAIVGANKRLTVKGLTAFDARNPDERAKAIAKTIGVSLELLSEDERARFTELAVFPEDADIPVGIAARLWAKTGGLDEIDAEDLLRRLESLSLLLSLDLERRSFRFHDTTRHFLQEQGGEDGLIALHKALLDSMDGAEADADEASRRYYFLHRPAHLDAAGERDKLAALLLDPAWLRAKLEAANSVQALIADYEQFALGEVQDLIGQTLRLISGICMRDKRQLLPQLHGRLMPSTTAAAFCANAQKLVVPIAILCFRPSLTPPGEELARLEGHEGSVWALTVLPDGRLASGARDTIRLWDPKTGEQLARLEGHEGWVTALAVLPDGRLASGAVDHTIRLWDPKTGEQLARLEGHEGSVDALAVLPDGRLASGARDNVRLWDPKTGEQLARLEGHEAWVSALAVLPDGRLASGAYDKTIRLWDPKTGEQLARLEGHERPVNALAVLPDGRLASGAIDNTIRLWDPKTGKQLARLQGHEGWVRAVTVLPDGRLASGADDKTIRLWDSKTGEQLARLEGHGGPVGALAMLPDGRLASGAGDNTIRLWDPKTGEQLARLEGHGGPVGALAVLPDGRLASGADDRTIRLWDVKTGEQLARLEGHAGWVRALAVLPNGRLASGAGDRTIRLWDVKTGQEIARLEVDFAAVLCLAVLGKNRLAAGDSGGRIHWLEIVD